MSPLIEQPYAQGTNAHWQEVIVFSAHDDTKSAQINSIGQGFSIVPSYAHHGTAELAHLYNLDHWKANWLGISGQFGGVDEYNLGHDALASGKAIIANHPYTRPRRWQTDVHPTTSHGHFAQDLISDYATAKNSHVDAELAYRIIVYTEFSSYDSEIDVDYDGELSFEVSLDNGMTLFAALQLDGKFTAGILDVHGKIVRYEERMSEEEYRQILHNV